MLYFMTDPDIRADRGIILRNRERPDGMHGRCLLCEAPVNNDRTAKWFHVHDGGIAIVTEAEANALNADGQAASDCGGHPIGPECYRKHKAVLAPYVNGGK